MLKRKKMTPAIAAVILAVFQTAAVYCAADAGQPSPGRRHAMSLTRAARRWDQAMPTGNGRVGALVYGNIPHEQVILNHDSLFIRSEKPTLPDVAEHLPKMRAMIAEGRYNEAPRFFYDKIRETYDYRGPDSFHPAFDITLDMAASNPRANVRRVVDFETGEVVVTWKEGKVTYQRKLFVSRKDAVVVMQIRASKPGMVHCRLGLLPTALKRSELGDGKNVRVPRFPKSVIGKAKISLKEVPITFNLAAEGDLLTLLAKYDVGGSYKMIGGEYGGVARVIVRGGRSETSDLQVHSTGADEVLLICGLFANEPSFPALQRLRTHIEGLPTDYDELLRRHVALHRELFLRTRLDLGGEPRYRALPNQRLLEEVRHGRGCNAMMERLFDFGRFALICASSSEGMPANLQGIWNGEYGPSWASDYHNDINIQMNYAQALPGNMPELTLTYFGYYESMMDDYRTNARNIYGCRGIWAPICQTTNGLAYYARFVSWTGAGGWLSQLFYDYWLFTGDREFLRQRAVPFLKQVALFYEDFLIEGADGKYMFTPSYSPENAPRNTGSSTTINATMDIALAREVLTNLCDACQRLDIEEEGVKRWRKMLAKLPPYRINEDGALAEWVHPGFQDNYGHRHLTHLYPLFPGMEMSLEETEPRLVEACRTALKLKMRNLPGAFGGTYFLLGGNYARLEDGDAALRMLEILARDHTHPNLFSLMQKRRPIMQFDGTAGIPAMILEMLVISKPGMIKLLPALPKAWPTGRVKGLSARGGFQIDIAWKDGKLTEAAIHARSTVARADGRAGCKVRYRDKVVTIKTETGKSYRLDGALKAMLGPLSRRGF